MAEAPVQPALVVLWAAAEADRIGEVALLPPGSTGVIGRGDEDIADAVPGAVRLQLVRQRPGSLIPAAPISNPKISRAQIAIDAADGGLRIRQVGRCPLLFRGDTTEQFVAKPGDVFALGNQLVFGVARRPAWLGASGPPLSVPERFGGPDQHGLVGESPAMWRMRQQIAFVAASSEHVLIHGPTGTGKELIAAAIHASSERGERPWVSRNAATFPDALVDAELFGHARNYPNAGMPERRGLVGQAHETTLFLDELGELPSAAQAHLLRALDNGEYQQLGESATRRSSFRLIAATNRPVEALKHDLAARLRLRVAVPGLDVRPEDVPLLLVHVLRDLARRHQAGAERFFPGGDPDAVPNVATELIIDAVTRPFAGNVRDLQRLVWDAIAASPGNRLDVPPAGRADEAAPTTSGRTATVSPAEVQACLDKHEGRIDLSWAVLGLPSRHALARLVVRHGLRAGRTWRPPDQAD